MKVTLGGLSSMEGRRPVAVEGVLNLTPSTYLLRLCRGDVVFIPGQSVILGLPGHRERREYSLYNSVDAPMLEVLIREVEGGFLSQRLRRCRRGDLLEMDGPVGYFTLDPARFESERFLFVASGTGIAPFHSMVTSYYPRLDYRLLHGVRHGMEAYDRGHYDPRRYSLCTSRDASGDIAGRVTDALGAQPAWLDAACYLCGNAAMIDAVFDLLRAQGVPAAQIHAEVYF